MMETYMVCPNCNTDISEIVSSIIFTIREDYTPYPRCPECRCILHFRYTTITKEDISKCIKAV